MHPQATSLTGVPPIAAMTTDAERECFYRLVREADPDAGAVVELGAWLGASTAYIAAALRDRGDGAKVAVYDKFQSKPGHVAKVEAWYNEHGLAAQAPVGDAYQQFLANLGPLKDHVVPYQGEIRDMTWSVDAPIAVLITDAPKRVPAIVSIMTKFAGAMDHGSVMAWQDFCHFPSYEIAACLYRLRSRIEFLEAVVPGTTLVFRVLDAWTPEEVSTKALALESWTPDEIAAAWAYWLDGPVPEEKAELFRCGRAMFLCDLGHGVKAQAVLAEVLDNEPRDVIAKWQYLHRTRADFRTRYAPLFELLSARGLLS